MSGSNSIQLPSLDKKKLRELASQARAAGAKQAQEAANSYPSPSDIYFREPVKVAADDPEYDSLQNKLGNYNIASKLILSTGGKSELLGVDRQPATPLPSKDARDGFFPRSSRNPNMQKRLIGGHNIVNDRREKDKITHGSGLNDKHNVSVKSDNKNDKYNSKVSTVDPKHKVHDSGYGPHKGQNPVQNKDSSHASDKSVSSHNQNTSTSVKPDSNRRSHGDSRKHANFAKTQSPNHTKTTQPEKSRTQSVDKEIVSQSKSQPVHERESILSSFGKELASSTTKSSASASANVTPDLKKDGVDKSDKASANRPVDSSILKEKEENRNGMVNSRVKPTLHIPEKNLEEMLKELTHIPQPLTALHTPFKEEGKFPFQVPEKIQPVSKELKKEPGSAKDAEAVLREVARSTSLDMIEPIASPNGDSDDSLSDSSDALEEGEIQSVDSDDDVIAPAGAHSSLNASKVPQITPVSTSKGPTAPVKEPRKSSSRISSGSSDSSSSGSDDSSSSDSESEAEDNAVSEDEEENLHKNEVTPPKSKTSPLKEETSPLSGSKQKWDLRSFLPAETPLLGPSSVKSLDGPASNKSDANHYLDDVLDGQPMRSADQVISDDNPPSDKVPDDHDTFSKPLSDDFSPPSLPHKHPVMSPIRSPAKTSYSRTNVSDAVHKNLKTDSSPLTPTNTYDNIKFRKRTPSVKSPEITERISTPKAKRGRKPKQAVQSSDSSSSEDEKDTDVISLSDIKNVKESPKSLPKSPRKSQNVSKTDRSATPVKASKKKEIKQEKQVVEKDSVRLKNEAKKLASKTSDCDKSVSDKSDLSSTSSTKLESDSIEKIFDKFQPECLLSPIPNVPEKSHVSSVHKEIIPASKEKPVSLNGSVTYKNGKPSVMVRINLELLSIHLNLDNSKQIDKDRVSVAINEKEIRTTHGESKLRTKVDTGIKSTATENSRTKSESTKVTSLDNLSNKVTSALKNDVGSCDKSKLLPSVKNNIAESVIKCADNSKGACATEKVLSSESPDYSSFDSLPVRQCYSSPSKLAGRKVSHASSSDSSCSSGSDSSSDSEDEHSMEINHLSPVPDRKAETCVQASEVKKRKSDAFRSEDLKRRKTASRSPHKASTVDVIHKEEKHEEKDREWNRNHTIHSKERRSSNSSQHSTHSNWSSHSAGSTLSQPGHSRKKARVEPAKEPPSNSSTNHTDHLSSSNNKHPIKSEPIEVQVNGHVPQFSAPDSSNHPAEGNHTKGFPYWLDPNVRDEEERLEDANVYHIRAKKYKHQADVMEPGLQQNILYLEAALCFIQSGCAMERNHKGVEASSFFKETQRFVVHNPHFRMPHDPESANRAELKLAVLCLRVQSLLYLKMFMLTKNESAKLKRVLEDHHSKSLKSVASQPKPPPSAPSPHQTWNRSTGTPSPMSPTPSPVGSVCSVGSAGSMNELTPSKSTNGTSAPLAPAGHVAVPQRIHSITQKYFTITNYLISCHDLWDQADAAVSSNIKEFFTQLDMEHGRLTMQSSLYHLVRYVRHGLQLLKNT